MSGLIDTTGLSLGTGLYFRAGLGGAGLYVETSLAAQLLAGEANGLALSGIDCSCVVRHKTTSANNFSGNVNSKFTYTAPSTKWILAASGSYQSGTTLRTEYDASGTALGIRIEEARTNVVLRNRDLSNASWTKTNVTAAKDQTGIDGVANAASSITATAGNGTCLQAITLASSARYQTAFVRRLTGSGTVEMTMDNGATWTAVTVTSSWTRVSIATQTLANPTVGFRIVTNGDAIAVDFVQNENGTFATSPIEVPAGSTVTRAVDQVSLSVASAPSFDTYCTEYARFSSFSIASAQKRALNLTAGADTNVIVLYQNNLTPTAYMASSLGGTGKSTFSDITAGTTIKIAASFATNDTRAACFGTLGTPDTSCNMPVGNTFIYVGSSPSGFNNINGHIKDIIMLPRISNNGQLQALTT